MRLYGVKLHGGAVQNRTIRRGSIKKQDSTTVNFIVSRRSVSRRKVSDLCGSRLYGLRLYGVGVFYINIDQLATIIFLFLIEIDNWQVSK